jgi:hypothetical protein
MWLHHPPYSLLHDILSRSRVNKWWERLIFHSHSLFPFLAHSQPEAQKCAYSLQFSWFLLTTQPLVHFWTVHKCNCYGTCRTSVCGFPAS